MGLCQPGGVLEFHKAQMDLAFAEQSTADAERGCVGENYSSAAAEAVPGLSSWLTELSLSNYAMAAALWAEEEGAADLEDVLDNLADFADALDLKRLERRRLEKNA